MIETRTGPADLVTELRALTARRVHIIPELRVMYMSTPKNACTTLRWMMAELAGEDIDALTEAGMSRRSPALTPDTAIHFALRRMKHALTPAQVPEALLAKIHPDNNWFVFGVLRDPRVRLFSAWQNKLLLQNPAYAKHREQPWFPRLPESAAWVMEDFARFVETLRDDPAHPLRRDSHFAGQSRLLMKDVVPYTRLYQTHELDLLRADITAHLQQVGKPADVTLRRTHEMPLKALTSVFAGGVQEAIEQIYAADFKEFGEQWPATPGRPGEWSEAELSEALLGARLSRRVGDFRSRLLKSDAEVAELRSEVQRLRGKVRRLKSQKLRHRQNARRSSAGPSRALRLLVSRVRGVLIEAQRRGPR